jgi:putative endonuclease
MGLAEMSLRMQQRMLGVMRRWEPVSTLPPHLVTGLRGEEEALFYLRRLGFTIVAQRWTSPKLRGDLDLVGWDGETLVIFEVKTRTMRDFAPADTAVDRGKRRQLRLMAQAWLKQLPKEHRDRVPVRFDIVAVYLLRGGAEFEHFRSVFGFHDRG